MEPERVAELIESGELRPLADLAGLAGVRRGTLSRWIQQGRMGARLEGVWLRGCWHSTAGLVLSFIANQTRQRTGSVPGGESLQEREERGRAAAARVAAMRRPR